MKFNVHQWNGRDWVYIATATAENEHFAARMIASRFRLTGRFASYPHIDSPSSQVTSRTPFTLIEA